MQRAVAIDIIWTLLKLDAMAQFFLHAFVYVQVALTPTAQQANHT